MFGHNVQFVRILLKDRNCKSPAFLKHMTYRSLAIAFVNKANPLENKILFRKNI